MTAKKFSHEALIYRWFCLRRTATAKKAALNFTRQLLRCFYFHIGKPTATAAARDADSSSLEGAEPGSPVDGQLSNPV